MSHTQSAAAEAPQHAVTKIPSELGAGATPGPWFVSEPFTIDVLTREPTSIDVVFYRNGNEEQAAFLTVDGSDISPTEMMANAHLIAAAPDLLNALRNLVQSVESAAAHGVDISGYVGLGESLAAIEKATANGWRNGL